MVRVDLQELVEARDGVAVVAAVVGVEGGAEGGTVVAEGTPEDIAAVPESYTGKFLAEVIGRAAPPQRSTRRRKATA